ncbi:ATP-binding protein [Tessaracoccus sp. MC1627]|uniref:ATP-binding protein n=1 Tax=Tessaracoccus sp. MC1627 TaxID=2760312 RepID=UPI0016007DBE|nr:DUF4143 domain-containing protein [Tessaracoccus sp. MC1627]MBB1511069.1 ATP-binding protein [Tessaracoccus sp. MC1627]
MAYERRILDEVLDELFPHLAAISVEGAKGVGKTATGTQRAESVLTLTSPQQRDVVVANPDYITQLPPPLLIDEWQLVPEIWDRVRHAVDADATGGRFLLAGSATVPAGVRIHSGAGRIVSLTMRPLTVHERGLAESTVSLRALLTGTQETVAGASPLRLPDYVDEILASGFPGIRGLPERARQVQLDSYLIRIVERELAENGVTVRRPEALKAWLTAYAAATATDAAYTTILDAATAGDIDKPARSTVDAYREQLARLFILDPIPAWLPAFNPLKRLARSPKHHLVDPALSARLVGVSKPGLLAGEGRRVDQRTGTWLGALFESLTAQSIRVYAEAAWSSVGHLRTQDGTREVDLIVEGEDHRVLAIEVKLAPSVGDSDVRHLNWLHTHLGDRLVDKLVVTTGDVAYRRSDGVAVVPLALLGP